MDDNKSKQERLFHQSRELCIDNIEDELRLVDAKALEMSQYSILGDAIYNLDYISKIDMSTPRGGVDSSEFMKRYKAIYIGPRRGLMSINLMYLYLRVKVEHDSNSVEPFMSYEEYADILPLYIKDILDTTIVGLKRMSEIYNRSLPVQNVFIYCYGGGYLLLIKGKLYPVTFILNSIINLTDGLFVNIYNFTVALNVIQNLKQLRKKIKVKRIKKR